MINKEETKTNKEKNKETQRKTKKHKEKDRVSEPTIVTNSARSSKPAPAQVPAPVQPFLKETLNFLKETPNFPPEIAL